MVTNKIIEICGLIPINYSKENLSSDNIVFQNDPDFNPQINAFYYLRILEIPSPRYTLWDEIKYGVKYPEETKRIIQERAWSSPIWYKPDKRN